MRMRSLKSVAWIPVVIVLVGCDQEHVQLPAPIRPVRYVIAQPSGGVRERIFTGAAKAGIESNLSFKVRGTIQKLGLKVGDRVRKNQLIAEIDPRDYELAVQQTEASLAQAKAQAAKAEADFKRMRRLFERDNASQADFDSARAAQDSARALVRAIEKQIELAKLQVSYTRLVSPIDGKVAEVPVEVNENVQVGQTIVVLHAGARPEVEVAMPEVLIREIRQGAAVSVALDSLPNRSFSGRVSEVGVAAIEGLTTYPVTILLDRSDDRILPGMAAEVTFRFGVKGALQRYVLPSHAVLEDREGSFVFVVSPTEAELGVAERRGVVVGELVTGGIEVVEGISDGDRVVTVGASRIQDGQLVRLAPGESP